MEFADARTLLSRVAILDNRQVDAATVMLWQEILDPYTLEEALWALRQWARANTGDYLRPAHLAQIIDEKRREYRWMNPNQVHEKDAWLAFEQELDRVAKALDEYRRENPNRRYAVDVMDAYTPKELEA